MRKKIRKEKEDITKIVAINIIATLQPEDPPTAPLPLVSKAEPGVACLSAIINVE